MRNKGNVLDKIEQLINVKNRIEFAVGRNDRDEIMSGLSWFENGLEDLRNTISVEPDEFYNR